MTRNRDHAARPRRPPTAATLGFRPRKAKELLPTKSWSGEMTKNRDLRLPHAAHVDKIGWSGEITNRDFTGGGH